MTSRVNGAMAFAESGVNPLHSDAEGFRLRTLRRIEQRLRPERVGAEEAAGVDHSEAVVRFGREVNDSIRVFFERFHYGRAIRYVAAYKAMTGLV